MGGSSEGRSVRHASKDTFLITCFALPFPLRRRDLFSPTLSFIETSLTAALQARMPRPPPPALHAAGSTAGPARSALPPPPLLLGGWRCAVSTRPHCACRQSCCPVPCHHVPTVCLLACVRVRDASSQAPTSNAHPHRLHLPPLPPALFFLPHGRPLLLSHRIVSPLSLAPYPTRPWRTAAPSACPPCRPPCSSFLMLRPPASFTSKPLPPVTRHHPLPGCSFLCSVHQALLLLPLPAPPAPHRVLPSSRSARCSLPPPGRRSWQTRWPSC